MYGLVNKALAQMVVTLHGAHAWEKIKNRAQVDVDVFVSMDRYPDDVTYKLVGAASEVLGAPPDELLEAFGEYWTLYTSQSGYGEYFKVSGTRLKDFLANLDHLHARVGLIYPGMKLPSFTVQEIDDTSLLLYYRSEREGLAPMVTGLVKGLANLFNESLHIAHIGKRTQDNPVDTFRVTLDRPQ